MQTPAKYYILIPVFNRREITLACLRQLQPLVDTGQWQVCVIDDGSTDGTADAITLTFPETTVLDGDGNLYWTGAMEMGMRHAIQQGAQCCIWMNDDLITTIDTVVAVVEVAEMRQAVVAAEGVVQHDKLPPYYFPGFHRGKCRLETRELDLASKEPIRVDCCRGNLVAIPRCVVDRIGYPDGENIPHYGGDTDYTLRATAAGFSCLTLVSSLFHEKEIVRDDNRSWLLDDRPPLEIWKSSVAKKGVFYPQAFWTYQLRHWGWRGVLNFCFGYAKIVVILALKLALPKPVLLKLYAKRSHTYLAYLGIEKSS